MPDRKTHEEVLSRKEGCLIIGGHLGSVDAVAVTAALCNLKEHKMYGVATQQSNRMIDFWLKKKRLKQNILSLYHHQPQKKIFQLLKEGAVVAMAADQDAGVKRSFYPFLGHLSSTFEGPAFFARLTKCPIYFFYSYFNEKNQIFVSLEKLKRPDVDPKEKEEWTRAFTYQWVKVLEKKVLEHISSYYWLHRRWKSKPKDVEATWKFWHDWEKKNNLPLSVRNKFV